MLSEVVPPSECPLCDQTERRLIQGERVSSTDKIVSLFESHTDIIVKGFRDVQYGHKIKLSSETGGFITALTIEEGNPADKTLFLPVLDFHRSVLGKLPRSEVADGGYASEANVAAGRAMGFKHVVCHKPDPENDQKDAWKGHAMHALGLNLG